MPKKLLIVCVIAFVLLSLVLATDYVISKYSAKGEKIDIKIEYEKTKDSKKENTILSTTATINGTFSASELFKTIDEEQEKVKSLK